MKHLFAIFVTIFLPLGANLTQESFYCYAAEVTGGNWIETCVETRQDGTQRTCISEYIGGVRIIEVCEES